MEGRSLHTRDELLDELNKTNVPLFTVMLMDDRNVDSGPNSRKEGLMERLERFPHDSALASGGSDIFLASAIAPSWHSPRRFPRHSGSDGYFLE